MIGKSDALTDVRRALKPLESRAKSQHWDKESPWRVDTHTWWEHDVLVIDLHDLGAGVTKGLLDIVIGKCETWSIGALVLVVGRGRHSISGGKLGHVVRGRLGPVCHAKGWEFRPHRSGRIALIWDRSSAPALLTGKTSWGFAILLAVAAAIFLAAAWFSM